MVLLAACEVVTVEQRNEKTPVIEAFIMPQKDTLSVTIQYMIPYSGTEADSVQLPASQVQVYMITGSDSLLMSEDPGKPGTYRMVTAGLSLKPGDSIKIYGLYENTAFRASTRIPDPVESLAISDNSIYYTAGDPRSMMQAGNLVVSWLNPSYDFYYVMVENVETDPEPLNEMVADMPTFGFAFPSQADQFQVSMRNIRYFGKHRVIVFHVNPEYADLFDNSELTSNAITRPPGNIENAMGIFTALTMDTVYFTVYKN